MDYVVPMERLELSRYCYRGILNPLRLPFRHLGNRRCPNPPIGARQSGFTTNDWSKTYRNLQGCRFPIRGGTRATLVRWRPW